MNIRTRGIVAVFLALPMLLAGCGGSDHTTSAGSKAVKATDPAAAKLLPKAIAESGKLVFATDATFAPNEFVAADGKTLQGQDIELAKAIAAALGVQADIKNVRFDSILPGIQAKRYDLAISTMLDSKKREQIVDFVTYSNVGGQAYFLAQNASKYGHIASYGDLCGYSVAAQSGSVDLEEAQKASKECVAKGDKAADVKAFPDQNSATLAVTSGQVEVALANSAAAGYLIAHSDGKLAGGKVYLPAPNGMPMAKGTTLPQAVQLALQGLMDDGTYQKIFEKWGQQAAMIDKAGINGAIS